VILQLAQDGSCAIAGKDDPRSQNAARRGQVFREGRPNEIRVAVRDGSCVVSVNMVEIIRHESPDWSGEFGERWILGALGDWTVREVTLHPVEADDSVE